MAFFFINEGDDQFTIISFSLPLGCASDPDLRRCPRGSSVYSQLALRIKFFGVTSLTLLCDRFMSVLSTTQFSTLVDVERPLPRLPTKICDEKEALRSNAFRGALAILRLFNRRNDVMTQFESYTIIACIYWMH